MSSESLPIQTKSDLGIPSDPSTSSRDGVLNNSLQRPRKKKILRVRKPEARPLTIDTSSSEWTKTSHTRTELTSFGLVNGVPQSDSSFLSRLFTYGRNSPTHTASQPEAVPPPIAPTTAAPTISKQYWLADELCTACYDCQKEFSFLRRRHHCRLCGRVFCGVCSSYRIPGVKFDLSNSVRVCAHCYEISNKEQQAQSAATAKSKLGLPSPAEPTATVSATASPGGATASATASTSTPSSKLHLPAFPPASLASAAITVVNKQRGVATRDASTTAAPTISTPTVATTGAGTGAGVRTRQEHTQGSSASSAASTPLLSANPQNMLSPSQFSLLGNSANLGSITISGTNLNQISEGEPLYEESRIGGNYRGMDQEEPSDTEDSDSAPDFSEFPEKRIFSESHSNSLLSTLSPSDPSSESLSFNFPNSRRDNSQIIAALTDTEAMAALSNVSDLHLFRVILSQCQAIEHSRGYSGKFTRKWAPLIFRLARHTAAHIQPTGDIRDIFKIKTIPGGRISQSEYFSGVAFSGAPIHKKMLDPSLFGEKHQLRIALFSGALEYDRLQNRLTSLDIVRQQEHDYLALQTARLLELSPDVVITHRAVAQQVRSLLLQSGVVVISGVRHSTLAALAHATGATVLPSTEHIRSGIDSCGIFTRLQIREFEIGKDQRETKIRRVVDPENDFSDSGASDSEEEQVLNSGNTSETGFSTYSGVNGLFPGHQTGNPGGVLKRGFGPTPLNPISGKKISGGSSEVNFPGYSPQPLLRAHANLQPRVHSKMVTIVDGCHPCKFASIILRGANHTTLKIVKKLLSTSILAAYALLSEASLLSDIHNVPTYNAIIDMKQQIPMIYRPLALALSVITPGKNNSGKEERTPEKQIPEMNDENIPEKGTSPYWDTSLPPFPDISEIRISGTSFSESLATTLQKWLHSVDSSHSRENYFPSEFSFAVNLGFLSQCPPQAFFLILPLLASPENRIFPGDSFPTCTLRMLRSSLSISLLRSLTHLSLPYTLTKQVFNLAHTILSSPPVPLAPPLLRVLSSLLQPHHMYMHARDMYDISAGIRISPYQKPIEVNSPFLKLPDTPDTSPQTSQPGNTEPGKMKNPENPENSLYTIPYPIPSASTSVGWSRISAFISSQLLIQPSIAQLLQNWDISIALHNFLIYSEQTHWELLKSFGKNANLGENSPKKGSEGEEKEGTTKASLLSLQLSQPSQLSSRASISSRPQLSTSVDTSGHIRQAISEYPTSAESAYIASEYYHNHQQRDSMPTTTSFSSSSSSPHISSSLAPQPSSRSFTAHTHTPSTTTDTTTDTSTCTLTLRSPFEWLTHLALPAPTPLLHTTASNTGVLLPSSLFLSASTQLILPTHYLRSSHVPLPPGKILPASDPDSQSIDVDSVCYSLWPSDMASLSDIYCAEQTFADAVTAIDNAATVSSKVSATDSSTAPAAALSTAHALISYRDAWSSVASLHLTGNGIHHIPLPTRCRFAFGHPSSITSSAPLSSGAVDPYFAVRVAMLRSPNVQSHALAEWLLGRKFARSHVGATARYFRENTHIPESRVERNEEIRDSVKIPVYSLRQLPYLGLIFGSEDVVANTTNGNPLMFVNYPYIPSFGPPLSTHLPPENPVSENLDFSGEVSRSLGFSPAYSMYIHPFETSWWSEYWKRLYSTLSVVISRDRLEHTLSESGKIGEIPDFMLSEWIYPPASGSSPAPCSSLLSSALPLFLFTAPSSCPPCAPPLCWLSTEARATLSWRHETEQCIPPTSLSWSQYGNDDLSLITFINAHFTQRQRCINIRCRRGTLRHTIALLTPHGRTLITAKRVSADALPSFFSDSGEFGAVSASAVVYGREREKMCKAVWCWSGNDDTSDANAHTNNNMDADNTKTRTHIKLRSAYLKPRTRVVGADTIEAARLLANEGYYREKHEPSENEHSGEYVSKFRGNMTKNPLGVLESCEEDQDFQPEKSLKFPDFNFLNSSFPFDPPEVSSTPPISQPQIPYSSVTRISHTLPALTWLGCRKCGCNAQCSLLSLDALSISFAHFLNTLLSSDIQSRHIVCEHCNLESTCVRVIVIRDLVLTLTTERITPLTLKCITTSIPEPPISLELARVHTRIQLCQATQQRVLVAAVMRASMLSNYMNTAELHVLSWLKQGLLHEHSLLDLTYQVMNDRVQREGPNEIIMQSVSEYEYNVRTLFLRWNQVLYELQATIIARLSTTLAACRHAHRTARREREKMSISGPLVNSIPVYHTHTNASSHAPYPHHGAVHSVSAPLHSSTMSLHNSNSSLPSVSTPVQPAIVAGQNTPLPGNTPAPGNTESLLPSLGPITASASSTIHVNTSSAGTDANTAIVNTPVLASSSSSNATPAASAAVAGTSDLTASDVASTPNSAARVLATPNINANANSSTSTSSAAAFIAPTTDMSATRTGFTSPVVRQSLQPGKTSNTVSGNNPGMGVPEKHASEGFFDLLSDTASRLNDSLQPFATALGFRKDIPENDFPEIYSPLKHLLQFPALLILSPENEDAENEEIYDFNTDDNNNGIISPYNSSDMEWRGCTSLLHGLLGHSTLSVAKDTLHMLHQRVQQLFVSYITATATTAGGTGIGTAVGKVIGSDWNNDVLVFEDAETEQLGNFGYILSCSGAIPTSFLMGKKYSSVNNSSGTCNFPIDPSQPTSAVAFALAHPSHLHTIKHASVCFTTSTTSTATNSTIATTTTATTTTTMTTVIRDRLPQHPYSLADWCPHAVMMHRNSRNLRRHTKMNRNTMHLSDFATHTAASHGDHDEDNGAMSKCVCGSGGECAAGVHACSCGVARAAEDAVDGKGDAYGHTAGHSEDSPGNASDGVCIDSDGNVRGSDWVLSLPGVEECICAHVCDAHAHRHIQAHAQKHTDMKENTDIGSDSIKDDGDATQPSAADTTCASTSASTSPAACSLALAPDLTSDGTNTAGLPAPADTAASTSTSTPALPNKPTSACRTCLPVYTPDCADACRYCPWCTAVARTLTATSVHVRMRRDEAKAYARVVLSDTLPKFRAVLKANLISAMQGYGDASTSSSNSCGAADAAGGDGGITSAEALTAAAAADRLAPHHTPHTSLATDSLPNTSLPSSTSLSNACLASLSPPNVPSLRTDPDAPYAPYLRISIPLEIQCPPLSVTARKIPPSDQKENVGNRRSAGSTSISTNAWENREFTQTTISGIPDPEFTPLGKPSLLSPAILAHCASEPVRVAHSVDVVGERISSINSDANPNARTSSTAAAAPGRASGAVDAEGGAGVGGDDDTPGVVDTNGDVLTPLPLPLPLPYAQSQPHAQHTQTPSDPKSLAQNEARALALPLLRTLSGASALLPSAQQSDAHYPANNTSYIATIAPPAQPPAHAQTQQQTHAHVQGQCPVSLHLGPLRRLVLRVGNIINDMKRTAALEAETEAQAEEVCIGAEDDYDGNNSVHGNSHTKSGTMSQISGKISSIENTTQGEDALRDTVTDISEFDTSGVFEMQLSETYIPENSLAHPDSEFVVIPNDLITNNNNDNATAVIDNNHGLVAVDNDINNAIHANDSSIRVANRAIDHNAGNDGIEDSTCNGNVNNVLDEDTTANTANISTNTATATIPTPPPSRPPSARSASSSSPRVLSAASFLLSSPLSPATTIAVSEDSMPPGKNISIPEKPSQDTLSRRHIPLQRHSSASSRRSDAPTHSRNRRANPENTKIPDFVDLSSIDMIATCCEVYRVRPVITPLPSVCTCHAGSEDGHDKSTGTGARASIGAVASAAATSLPYPNNGTNTNPNTDINAYNRTYSAHPTTASLPINMGSVFVDVYFPTEFHALRTLLCGSDGMLVQALSNAVAWAASGGKSGSTFSKTHNDGYVLKCVSSTEMTMLLKIAKQYFAYTSTCMDANMPSLLVPILGAYTVHTHRKEKGEKTSLRHFILMPNVTMGEDIVQTFDLKGSRRNRYIATKPGNGQVMLDQNFLELTGNLPLGLDAASRTYLRAALHNDTTFLCALTIVDYSLLVALTRNSQLVMGIIDYIRQYTWDKRLETSVKSVGLLAGKALPTVIPPNNYKVRFRQAMEKYFAEIPENALFPDLSTSVLTFPPKHALFDPYFTDKRRGYNTILATIVRKMATQKLSTSVITEDNCTHASTSDGDMYNLSSSRDNTSLPPQILPDAPAVKLLLAKITVAMGIIHPHLKTLLHAPPQYLPPPMCPEAPRRASVVIEGLPASPCSASRGLTSDAEVDGMSHGGMVAGAGTGVGAGVTMSDGVCEPARVALVLLRQGKPDTYTATNTSASTFAASNIHATSSISMPGTIHTNTIAASSITHTGAQAGMGGLGADTSTSTTAATSNSMVTDVSPGRRTSVSLVSTLDTNKNSNSNRGGDTSLMNVSMGEGTSSMSGTSVDARGAYPSTTTTATANTDGSAGSNATSSTAIGTNSTNAHVNPSSAAAARNAPVSGAHSSASANTAPKPGSREKEQGGWFSGIKKLLF